MNVDGISSCADRISPVGANASSASGSGSVQVAAAPGWSALTFSGTIAVGQTALRGHLIELRAAIDAARAGAGMVAVSHTDPTVTVNVTPIRALHICELRAALQ